jgi:hypothetical protein
LIEGGGFVICLQVRNTDLAPALAKTHKSSPGCASALHNVAMLLSRLHALRAHAPRLVMAAGSIWLFLVALQVMKKGARGLEPLLQGSSFIDSLPSALGLGWLSALLLLSGSPVAVSGLTLFAQGAIDRAEAFMILAGSRMGVSFVVFALAALYTIRRSRSAQRSSDGSRERSALVVGVAVVILTALVYLPGSLLGLAMLQAGWLDWISLTAPGEMLDFIDLLTAPVVTPLAAHLPAVVLFPIGVALLLLALRGFDSALPEFEAKTLDIEAEAGVRRRWLLFGIGCLVALVTMSVSVALTLLVPAISKGYISRRHVVPYILGANITTLGDTLLVALLLGAPGAPQLVLAELIGVLTVTLVLMVAFYHPLQRFSLWLAQYVADRPRVLCTALGALTCVPVALIVLR